MNAPVVAFTLTVPPPVDVAGELYDIVRPAGSVNAADPLTAPVASTGLPEEAEPATGVPASTVTVTVFVADLTPLAAVIVNVSVVDPVAA